MEDLIEIIINIVLKVVSVVKSCFQCRNKSFLFNNLYSYAAKQEREKMDKKPHYRQSGIVFALLSSIHLCIAVLAYAIISSIKEIRK